MPSGESGGGVGARRTPPNPHTHTTNQGWACGACPHPWLRCEGWEDTEGSPGAPVTSVPTRRPRRLAWHGSTARGSQARRRDCQGWRSSGPGEGLAAPLGEGKLLAGQRHNCSEELVVLCVEVAFPYRHMW